MSDAALFTGPLGRFFASADDEVSVSTASVGVEAWREDLNESLTGKLKDPVDWDEDPDEGYDSLAIPDVALRAVRLMAIYAERPELELPDDVPETLDADPVWREASGTGFQKSHYGHLVAAECWLPADFDFTFRCPRPDGDDWDFGSLHALADQVRFLNQRTFCAAEETLAGWMGMPGGAETSFFDAALRGLATFHAAVRRARELGKPLALQR